MNAFVAHATDKSIGSHPKTTAISILSHFPLSFEFENQTCPLVGNSALPYRSATKNLSQAIGRETSKIKDTFYLSDSEDEIDDLKYFKMVSKRDVKFQSLECSFIALQS